MQKSGSHILGNQRGGAELPNTEGRVEFSSVVSHIGTLGLGGLIGIVLKSQAEKNLQDRRMLFEARVKAYSGLTGRLRNFFLEPDISRLPNALRFTRINQLLSEALLLGSTPVVDASDEFHGLILKYYEALDAEDKVMQHELHDRVLKLTERLCDAMRYDLRVPGCRPPNKSLNPTNPAQGGR